MRGGTVDGHDGDLKLAMSCNPNHLSDVGSHRRHVIEGPIRLFQSANVMRFQFGEQSTLAILLRRRL